MTNDPFFTIVNHYPLGTNRPILHHWFPGSPHRQVGEQSGDRFDRLSSSTRWRLEVAKELATMADGYAPWGMVNDELVVDDG